MEHEANVLHIEFIALLFFNLSLVGLLPIHYQLTGQSSVLVCANFVLVVSSLHFLRISYKY